MDRPKPIREPLKQRKEVLKNEPYLVRYPRTVGLSVIFLCMAVLFSKPIYDIFTTKAPKFDLSEPTIKKRL